jgi:SPP1 gp7 family putative phage head morphogenesis protein
MKDRQNCDEEARYYIKQRHKEFLENIDDRPYLMWVAVSDNRTCELCRALDGCVFLPSDPVWDKMLQRIHKGCRCRHRAFTEKDMIKKGKTVSSSAAILKRFF